MKLETEGDNFMTCSVQVLPLGIGAFRDMLNI